MADPPFGFSLPGDSGDSDQGSGEGQSSAGGNPLGPLGALGNPQQLADALRQFADMMSYQGGPVNWDLAKNVARHAVAAEGDPSVLDSQRKQVDEALRLADLWLGDVTTFPSGIRSTQAWSRSEWVEATFPVWSKLCDPIAAKAVESMSGMFSFNPEDLDEVPPEMRSAMGAMAGGLSGLGPMMQQLGGAMVGGQTGAAVGALAREVVSSTDIGLPLGPEGVAALLPAGVAAFGGGLSVDEDEVRLFLALREAAHHR
ncbi:MAG: zinc-dependent metalloprotease, partial [Streptosporangiaceae bacterium]